MNYPGTRAGTTAKNLSGLSYVDCHTDGPVRYELRYTDCRNPRCKKCAPDAEGKRHASHGPTWYAIGKRPGTKKKFTAYIGRRLNTEIYRTPEREFDHDAYIRARNARREARETAKNEKLREVLRKSIGPLPLSEPERSGESGSNAEPSADAVGTTGFCGTQIGDSPIENIGPADPVRSAKTE